MKVDNKICFHFLCKNDIYKNFIIIIKNIVPKEITLYVSILVNCNKNVILIFKILLIS